MAESPDALRIGDGSDGDPLTVPVYDPTDDEPLRLAIPDGEGGVRVVGAKLADPEATRDHAWRLGTPAGVVAVEAGEPVTIVEDFESGDLAAWGDGGSDSVGSYDVDTGAPVYNGSYSLKDYSVAFTQITSESGLPVYPGPGDTFAFSFQVGSQADVLQVRYGRQTNDEEYTVRMSSDSDTLELQASYGGSPQTLDSASVSYPTETWIDVLVDWGTDGYQYVEVRDIDGNDIGSVSAVDDTYGEGGLQLVTHPDTSTPIVLDYLRIVE